MKKVFANYKNLQNWKRVSGKGFYTASRDHEGKGPEPRRSRKKLGMSGRQYKRSHRRGYELKRARLLDEARKNSASTVAPEQNVVEFQGAPDLATISH